jgi:hypothetical protein
MPTAEARIDTSRAERYLTQLCDHLAHLRHGSITARTGRRGEVVFSWGTCTILALDDALLVRAEASDAEDLVRAQALLAHRIEPSVAVSTSQSHGSEMAVTR